MMKMKIFIVVAAFMLIYAEEDAGTCESEHSEWSSPYEGKRCKRTPSETYTFDTKNGCDGWSKTDLETCKEYCSNNKLPPNCSPPGPLPVCTHVIWNKKGNWCHLAKACTMETYSRQMVIKKLKTEEVDEDDCKLESLGCFSDSSKRAMPEQILNGRSRSSNVFEEIVPGKKIDWDNYPKYMRAFACRCARIASTKGYTVIGLQFYGECWSGPNAHETYDKYGGSSKCIEGIKQKDGKYKPYNKDNYCATYMGEQLTNYVYRIAVPGCANHNIEPIGCFHDNMVKPRPVPNLIQNERRGSSISKRLRNGYHINWKNWVTYAPEMICRCAEAAKHNGDDYFAIQFWGECWSGKDSEVNYARNGKSTECRDEHYEKVEHDKECRCNSYACVGKKETNYVYKIHKPCTNATDAADDRSICRK